LEINDKAALPISRKAAYPATPSHRIDYLSYNQPHLYKNRWYKAIDECRIHLSINFNKTVAPSAAACRIPAALPHQLLIAMKERKLDYLEWFLAQNVQFPLGRHHQPHKSADTRNDVLNNYGALLDSKG